MLRRLLTSSVALGLAMAVLVVPSADAKKKPSIPFNGCSTAADQAGRTYRMSTGTTCTATEDGVEVSADNVTVDLGGFTLTGGSAHNGILIDAGVKGTRVLRGTITKFATGINGDTSTTGTLVKAISAISNGNGILIGPGTVRNSIAARNGIGIEIRAATDAGTGLITGSLAVKNSIGMEETELAKGVIDHSQIVQNTNRGIITAADTAIVRRSVVSGNGSEGINLSGATKNTVDHVQATSNGGQGAIFGAAPATLSRSTFLDNGRNGTSGFDMGVLISSTLTATVTSNTVDGSYGDGIVVPTANATVKGNTADANGWGVADGNNFGINAPDGHGHNVALGNDGDNQCVDDVLC